MSSRMRLNDPYAENTDKTPSDLTLGELEFSALAAEQRGVISLLRFNSELKNDKEYLRHELSTEQKNRQALYERCLSIEAEVRDLSAIRTQNEELVISNFASVVLTAIGGGLISSGYVIAGWIILLWGISANIFPVLIIKIRDWIRIRV